MTVTAILARAESLANVTGAGIFATAEKEGSLNAAYRDVYEEICESEDDYFATWYSFALSAMTAVSDETASYYIALPATFYRLRRLECKVGTEWYPIRKMSPNDENKRAGTPSYRLLSSNLYMLLSVSANISGFRMLYYPTPAAYTVSGGSTDIVFPPQLEPDILALQVAIDIIRKQNGDYGKLAQRRDELIARFKRAVWHRDDADSLRVANVYGTAGGVR